MVVADGDTDFVPLAAVDVVHEAEQDEALVDDQLSVDDWPAVTEDGDALKLTVGGGLYTGPVCP